MTDFNFFESYVEKPKKYTRGKTIMIGITGLLGLTLSIYPLLRYGEIKNLNKEINFMEEDIAFYTTSGKMEAITNKMNMLEAMKQQVNEIEVIEGEIFDNQLVSDELLVNIENCMSNEIFFTSIDTFKKEVEIRGNAKDKLAIAQFEHNLRKTSSFQDVFIPSIDENNGDYEFLITFKIKDVNNDEAF